MCEWNKRQKGEIIVTTFQGKYFCYNFTIFKANWTDAEKAKFLINLYYDN